MKGNDKSYLGCSDYSEVEQKNTAKWNLWLASLGTASVGTEDLAKFLTLTNQPDTDKKDTNTIFSKLCLCNS